MKNFFNIPGNCSAIPRMNVGGSHLENLSLLENSQNSLWLFCSTEWAKLKQMNFAEKRWYIWQYYKLHFFGLIFFGYIAFSLIGVWMSNEQEYLYIAWVGNPVDTHQLYELGNALQVIAPNDEIIVINNYSATEDPTENMAIQTRFMGLMLLNAIDLFLMPREAVYESAYEGLIIPITSVMYQLKQTNPQLHLNLLEINGENKALSLENSGLLNRLEIDCSNLYLAVIVGTDKDYEIAKALEVLFQ